MTKAVEPKKKKKNKKGAGRPKGSKNKTEKKERYPRPGEGGQPGNKNAEKWTEEKAVELGEDLIAWLRGDIGHIFYEKYIVDDRDLYPDIINYLARKFKSFSDLLKKAKKIQEFKILERGMNNTINTGMGIFALKNHHGYSDKNTITAEVTEKPHLDVKKYTTEELKTLRGLLEKGKPKDV